MDTTTQNVSAGAYSARQTTSIVPGIALTVALAAIGQVVHSMVQVNGYNPVSSTTVAILAGIVLANSVRLPRTFVPGVQFSLKTLLRYAIVLMGLRFSVGTVLQVGVRSILVIAIVVIVGIVLTRLIARAVGLPARLGLLIGVGTAICGNSAIAATAPVAGAEEREIALASTTITLFGLIAILLYPMVGQALGMTDVQFGTLAGVAVHDSGQAIAAGFIYSAAAGGVATIVKLTRTAFLLPVVLLVSWGQLRGEHAAADSGGGLNMARVVPWFALGFVGLAVVRTVGDWWVGALPLWQGITSASGSVSSLLIVMAMSAVGLRTDLREFQGIGARAFAVGLIGATGVALVALSLVML